MAENKCEHKTTKKVGDASSKPREVCVDCGDYAKGKDIRSK